MVNALGNEDSREKLRSGDIKLVELDARVARQAENAKKDYTGLITKYVDPLKSNLVQQIARFITPEGRLKGTGTDLLLYNLGLQWIANDKRTDIFGQTVKVLPGDQGIAWPRESDERWAKMWGYRIHISDVSPRDKLVVDGVERTLEWDEFIERKKLANKLFKQRFDEYFTNSTPEQLEKRFAAEKVDAKTGIVTNYIHEDINDIWLQTKDDVKASLFTWKEYAKGNAKVFDFLTKNSAFPDFYNRKFKIDESGYLVVASSGDDPIDLIILPYPSLEKINDMAMKGFLESAEGWVDQGDVDEEDFYKKIANSEWSDQINMAVMELNDELLNDIRQMSK